MANKLSLFAVGALACYAAAASAVVWSDSKEATFATAYSFTYADDIGSSVDTTNVNEAKVLDFEVASSTKSAYAGYGIGWKQSCDASWNCKDVAVSLSAYKGVCMTYKAAAGFRLDFKQSTIKDDNYYGADLAAAATPKTVYVAFKDLKKGWNSTSTVTWSAAAQLGIQFSYKNTHAKASGSMTNSVEISSFEFADSCITYAPELLEPYKSAVDPTETLNEGDTLSYALAEMFADADGDALAYTAKVVGENAGNVKLGDTLYAKTGVLNLITGANPSGSAVVTITASDPTGKSASYSVTVNTVDGENAPVAVNDEYETKEETKLVVTLKNSVIQNDYDADGDTYAPELVDSTTHGTLEFDAELGTFTYVPEKDFFGKDSFSYQLVEVDRADDPDYKVKTSNVAVVTITVINVDDPITVTVTDPAFTVGEDEYKLGDTVTVNEDFGSFVVKIPTANVEFSDPDFEGSSLPIDVATDGSLLSAAYVLLGTSHIVEVSSVADANGLAEVSLFAVDGKDTASVKFYVNVLPVADAPVAVDDSYEMIQDSLNKVAKTKGVLANDKNPDGKSVLKSYLVTDATEGTVVLDSTGAFSYEAGHYEGEDSFTYIVVNAEGDTSAPATVTLNVVYKNQPPQLVEGVADTVGSRLSTLVEDFTAVKRFTVAEMRSWFTDDTDAPSAFTFTVRSEDSLLAPSINTRTNILEIRAVKDACGEASVILTAKDKKGATTDLVIPATIACVNDKPVVKNLVDTLYIGVDAAWSDSIDLNQFVTDPDGDTLTFDLTTTKAFIEYFNWTLEDNMLIMSRKDTVAMEVGAFANCEIKAADSLTYKKFKLLFIANVDPASSIAPVLATPKATWQNAILADRGVAAIFDMQGRVMWKAKLPVSEADVRNAAAQVQGRKILRVNRQTWTIK